MSEQAGTVAEALIAILKTNGVDLVFGVPGPALSLIHLSLEASGIRHVRARHEQGAGFMADGYARVSGKPGVCIVTAGPGVTNVVTAMAQAYQDSVPLLVISAANARDTLGKGRGAARELPDQRGLAGQVALMAHTLCDPRDLAPVMERAFLLMRSGRRGPVHIEIPVDVMALDAHRHQPSNVIITSPRCDVSTILEVAVKCQEAQRPVILCGGGALTAAPGLEILAERLDAPIVSTAHGRGLFFDHPLSVPASPSLPAVRKLIADADLVLAIGTQISAPDYDRRGDGGLPPHAHLIRVDIDAEQLARGPAAVLSIHSTANNFLDDLLSEVAGARAENRGAERALAARTAAWREIGARARLEVGVLETIRDTLPGAIMIGDPTPTVEAGNLFFDAGRLRGWFNSATSFGASGYAVSAAIGASLAEPQSPVICLTDIAAIQSLLAELGTARAAGATVIFLVWSGDEGEDEAGSLDIVRIAEAFGIAAIRLEALTQLPEALLIASETGGSMLLEINRLETRGAAFQTQ